MVMRKLWLGTLGPFLYDDETPLDDPDLPGVNFSGLATTGQIVVDAPATDPKHILRNLDLAGLIVLWSGTIASIPVGWNLCDGTNGTPDLQDRFIVSAGGTYAPGDTGGSDSIDLTHAHDISLESGEPDSLVTTLTGVGTNVSSPSHTHAVSGVSEDESLLLDNRPLYYALAYIMKL